MNRRTFLKNSCRISAGLVAAYSVFGERYIILTNSYRITVPNLPKPFSGFRIVQLSDLHYGFLVPMAVIRSVIERANALKPDLIVCTEDYVHQRNSCAQIDEVWPVVSQLTAPLGVYSVLGNHDHWADTARSDYWLKRSGQDLRHKSVIIERDGARFCLVGGGDLWEDHVSLKKLLREVPEAACRIVLAHNPDTADTEPYSRFDLMLSGHTHGGQVDIPYFGPPILPVENKTYSSGLKRSLRGDKVFISKGIGWAICPVRVNCFPEIVVLELLPETVKQGT
jgi:uncharacterized protein